MTMIHIERDGKDQTAHIVSLDLLMDDSSVMTSTWPQQPAEKGRVNREGGAGCSPEIKERPLPLAFWRPEVLEAVSHIKTQRLKA